MEFNATAKNVLQQKETFTNLMTMRVVNQIIGTKQTPPTLSGKGLLPMATRKPSRLSFSPRNICSPLSSLQNTVEKINMIYLIGSNYGSEGKPKYESNNVIPGSLPGYASLLKRYAADGYIKGAPAHDENNDPCSIQNVSKNGYNNSPDRPLQTPTPPTHKRTTQRTKPFNEDKGLLVRSSSRHKAQKIDYLSLLRSPELLELQNRAIDLARGVSL